MSDTNIEELFDIKEEGFQNYKITKDGKIWNKLKFAKLHILNGYYMFGGHCVHRLVAKTFVPNLDNKPFVNHIDENTLNNNYTNLEWVTQKENVHKHSKSTSHKRKVKCVDITSNKEVKVYDTITEAAECLGISRRAIQHVLNGTNKTGGGFKWEYIDKSNCKDTVNLSDGTNVYDYENYYVFSNGAIYNSTTKKILKPVKNKAGRYYVTLCKDNKKQNCYIQCIIADHYLNDKPSEHAIVEHIDGDCSNNNVLNLKWGKDMKTKKNLKENAIQVIDTKL